MTAPLTLVLAVASLAFALGTALLAWRDRPAGPRTLLAAAVVEAGFVVQLVVGVVMLATTDRDVPGVLFVAYLVGVLLVLPVAVVWSRAEQSRWGTGVLVVAGLVDAVLLARLQQIWGGQG
ncbi:hypothetical protein GCM10027446_27000 [Angustibacter peucedani]